MNKDSQLIYEAYSSGHPVKKWLQDILSELHFTPHPKDSTHWRRDTMLIKIRVVGNDLTIITSSITLDDTQVEKFDLNPGAGWDSKASEKVYARIVDHIESMMSLFLGPGL